MKKRSVCCCICTFIVVLILLAAAAVTAFFLWARQPSVEFNGALPPENSKDSFVLNGATDFSFNLRLNFTVDNPNFIGATLSSIAAEGSLPVNKQVTLATGSLKDVGINKQAKTNILFPIKVDYKLKDDTDLLILKYIANNCGLLQNTQRGQLEVNYDLNIVAKIVAININLPTFSNDAKFDCPIPAGTKIPGLDLILKLYNGGLPNNIDPNALIATLQKQIPNLDSVDPSILNNIDPNTLNNIGSQLGPIATKILG
ncbi:hypothetical protein K502DRAFT_311119 [Neoconidiobolus thromboides FSU 785]|nr:hypothetical protein K502DRAFT_311119 [Neoconidiobolus thromboides FSU 785]